MKLNIVIAVIVAFTLAACDGGLKSLSNAEIAAKSDACIQGNPTSPGKVTACENIANECARRRKEGNFAC